MSLFDLFKSNKNDPNLERMVIGFFRTETSKLLGIEVNTKEFFDALSIPSYSGHLIQPIPATHSDFIRPPIPSIPATPEKVC